MITSQTVSQNKNGKDCWKPIFFGSIWPVMPTFFAAHLLTIPYSYTPGLIPYLEMNQVGRRQTDSCLQHFLRSRRIWFIASSSVCMKLGCIQNLNGSRSWKRKGFFAQQMQDEGQVTGRKQKNPTNQPNQKTLELVYKI